MRNNYSKTMLSTQREIDPRRWTTINYVLCPPTPSPKTARPGLPDIVSQPNKPWALEMEVDLQQRRGLMALDGGEAGSRASLVRIYPDVS